MVSNTRTSTNGYWRDNKDGTRTWIETSAILANQPKRLGAREVPAPLVPEQVEEPEPVTERISPLISSKELYQLDVQWEDWWKQYSKTGEIPVAPLEDRFAPYYEQFVEGIQTYEQIPEVQLQKADQLALTPFVTESGSYDIASARAAGVSEDILIRVFGESLPAPLTQQQQAYVLLYQDV